MQIITLTNAKAITLTGRVSVIILAQIGEFWTQILTVLGAPKGPILSIVSEGPETNLFSTYVQHNTSSCLPFVYVFFVCLFTFMLVKGFPQ